METPERSITIVKPIILGYLNSTATRLGIPVTVVDFQFKLDAVPDGPKTNFRRIDLYTENGYLLTSMFPRDKYEMEILVMDFVTYCAKFIFVEQNPEITESVASIKSRMFVPKKLNGRT